MTVTWNPGAGVRQTDQEGRSSGESPSPPPGGAPASLQLLVHPGASSTVCTIFEITRQGAKRWDRRTGTATLPLTRDDLQEMGTPRFLSLACKALVEVLTPPR